MDHERERTIKIEQELVIDDARNSDAVSCAYYDNTTDDQTIKCFKQFTCEELPNIKTEPELIIDDASNSNSDLCIKYEIIADSRASEWFKKGACKENNSQRERIKHFKCKNCDRCFHRKESRDRHNMFVHTGERSVSCDICKKTFVDKSSVRSHMEQHIQYYCPICNEIFRHTINIKRHMLVHNGLRPFSCHRCSKTYKHSSHLKRHVKHHEDERRYKDTRPNTKLSSENKTKARSKVNSRESLLRRLKKMWR